MDRLGKTLVVNGITVSREIMPVLALKCASDGNPCFSAALLAVSFVTDLIDGPLARKWKVEGTIGELNDVVADAIFFNAIFALVINHNQISNPESHGLIAIQMFFGSFAWVVSSYYRRHWRKKGGI